MSHAVVLVPCPLLLLSSCAAYAVVAIGGGIGSFIRMHRSTPRMTRYCLQDSDGNLVRHGRMRMQECKACHELRLLNEYYRSATNKDGLVSKCKRCMAQSNQRKVSSALRRKPYKHCQCCVHSQHVQIRTSSCRMQTHCYVLFMQLLSKQDSTCSVSSLRIREPTVLCKYQHIPPAASLPLPVLGGIC